MKKLLLTFLAINLFLHLRAQDFSIVLVNKDSISCAPFSTSWKFTNNSGKAVSAVEWDFGDGTHSDRESPSKLYQDTGTFSIKLKITFTDSTTCEAFRKHYVRVVSAPIINPNLIVSPSTTQCWEHNGVRNRFCFKYDYKAGDESGVKRTIINFGCGDTAANLDSNKKEFCYSYDSPGVYTISISVVSGFGCAGFRVWPMKVTVLRNEPQVDGQFSLKGNTLTGFNKGTPGGDYKWYVNDSLFSNKDTLRITPVNSGKYKIKLLSGYGPCSDQKDTSIFITGTGFEEALNEETITIYPNPFDNTLSIQFKKAIKTSVRLTLTDITGREVYQQDISQPNGNLAFEPGKLKAGMYLVKIEAEGQAFRQMVIKKE